MNKRVMLGWFSLGVGLGCVSWFGGWLIWDIFNLWKLVSNFMYQNLLLLVIAVIWTVSIGKTRPRPPMEQTSQPQSQTSNCLSTNELEERLKGMEEKLAVVNITKRILEKRESIPKPLDLTVPEYANKNSHKTEEAKKDEPTH